MLNFIQWHKKRQDELFKGINEDTFTERAKVFWNDSFSVRSFLEQPFEPYLITKLFEGWEQSGISFIDYENGNNSIVFEQYRKSGKLNCIIINSDYTIDSDAYPKDLDTFITHIQNTNIILIPKIEIKNNFPQLFE